VATSACPRARSRASASCLLCWRGRLQQELVCVVADFGSLDTVVRASQRDLEAVDGVGAVRAREIREGLRRLQEQNLVDRYLNL